MEAAARRRPLTQFILALNRGTRAAADDGYMHISALALQAVFRLRGCESIILCRDSQVEALTALAAKYKVPPAPLAGAQIEGFANSKALIQRFEEEKSLHVLHIISHASGTAYLATDFGVQKVDAVLSWDKTPSNRLMVLNSCFACVACRRAAERKVTIPTLSFCTGECIAYQCSVDRADILTTSVAQFLEALCSLPADNSTLADLAMAIREVPQCRDKRFELVDATLCDLEDRIRATSLAELFGANNHEAHEWYKELLKGCWSLTQYKQMLKDSPKICSHGIMELPDEEDGDEE
jgi:hypothetical protein